MSLAFARLDDIARAAARPATSARPTLVALAICVQTMLCVPAALAQNFGEWGPAVSFDPDRVIGINTEFNDGCPIESPDGRTLYFATDRPFKNLDIWIASRAITDGWTVQPLPLPVNTPTAGEFCPTPLPGNRLLFVSTRANNCGGTGPNADIYYTRSDDTGSWLEPQPLSCNVNSAGAEFSPSLVEAEGETLLFFSSDQGTPGKHRIYVSVLEQDGTWRAAEAVSELNDANGSDARPNVRKDGLEIVWDSTRDGLSQIYSATRSSVFAAWSAPTPLESCPLDCVNDPNTAQSRASLSRDGTRLYFGSTRANAPLGGAGADIYLSTRPGPGKGKQDNP